MWAAHGTGDACSTYRTAMYIAMRTHAMYVVLHRNTHSPAERGGIELELVEDDLQLLPQLADHRRGIAKLDLLSDTCTCDGERLCDACAARWN